MSLSEAEVESALSRALQNFGKIRLNINFLELFTTLIEEGIILPYDTIVPLTVPALSTIVITDTVDTGYVSVLAEERIVVGTDNALVLTAVFDTNKMTLVDPSMVQARYAYPRNYFATGALIPVRRNVVITVTNVTGSDVNLSVEDIGGKVRTDVWNKIIAKYFKTVAGELA